MRKKPSAKRTRDRYTVVLEGLRSDFNVFGEGLGGVRENVDHMKPKIEELTEDMKIVKAELRMIRHDLKEKVGREEFETLEQRVETLEKRIAVH